MGWTLNLLVAGWLSASAWQWPASRPVGVAGSRYQHQSSTLKKVDLDGYTSVRQERGEGREGERNSAYHGQKNDVSQFESFSDAVTTHPASWLLCKTRGDLCECVGGGRVRVLTAS